jgi:hypothetical protein
LSLYICSLSSLTTFSLRETASRCWFSRFWRRSEEVGGGRQCP